MNKWSINLLAVSNRISLNWRALLNYSLIVALLQFCELKTEQKWELNILNDFVPHSIVTIFEAILNTYDFTAIFLVTTEFLYLKNYEQSRTQHRLVIAEIQSSIGSGITAKNITEQ